jgi:hypothetical protein
VTALYHAQPFAPPSYFVGVLIFGLAILTAGITIFFRRRSVASSLSRLRRASLSRNMPASASAVIVLVAALLTIQGAFVCIVAVIQLTGGF